MEANILNQNRQPTDTATRKLASSSLLTPNLGNVYQPSQLAETQHHFFTASVNGTWQKFPSLVNQRVNRRIFKQPLSEDYLKAAPIRMEKTILPYLAIRENTQPETPVVKLSPVTNIPVTQNATMEKDKSLTSIIPQLKLDEVTSATIRSLFQDEEEGKNVDEDFASVFHSYRKQIENLLEESKNIDSQIISAQGEFGKISETLNSLSEQPTDQAPENQTKRIQQIKDSIRISDQHIELLTQKMKERKNLLEDFLQQSKNEIKLLDEAEANKKTSTTIISNLKSALGNAQQELEALKQKGATENQLQEKQTLVNSLAKKLEEKEAETKQIYLDLEKAQKEAGKVSQLTQEIENYQKDIQALSQKKETLSQQLTKEETEMGELRQSLENLEKENKEKEAHLESQEKALTQLTLEKEKITSFAQELAQKLADLKNKKRFEEVIAKQPETPVAKAENEGPKLIKWKTELSTLPPLTNLPNCLNGIVKDKNGQLLLNAVVIVKDASLHSIRALNTNGLGQFLITTPLSNGTYQIQVAKEGFQFDIIEVELIGKVINAIEIIAH